MTNQTQPDFTPALGLKGLTGAYDRVIAVMTRERRWRARLLSCLAPRGADTIIDLGSGTGTLAILVKRAVPSVRYVAVDPDPDVEAIARAKARAAGLDVEFVTALGGDAASHLGVGVADKVVSSLVLHQCSHEAKLALLRDAGELLKPNGQLVVADYGRQRGWLMPLLFNLVRRLDGYENTRANKDGEIPVLIGQAGFNEVRELEWIQTLTGSISLYTARKAV